MSEWKRSSFVTKGSDPTETVSWSNGETTIREFQDVYSVEIKGQPEIFEPSPIRVLGESLHKALENEYHRKLYGDVPEVGPERVEFILKVVVERRVIRERLTNGIDETQASELIADFEVSGGFKTVDEAVNQARESADLVARNL